MIAGRWAPAVASLILAWPGCLSAADAEPVVARPFFFALSVADVEASAAWYERTLGFEPRREIDRPERGLRIRLLASEGAYLELAEQAAARPLDEAAPGIERRHQLHGVFKIGFRCADLDEAIERLERLGVPLRGRVVTEADGSLRSLQIEDPDGNVIQLFEVLGAEP